MNYGAGDECVNPFKINLPKNRNYLIDGWKIDKWEPNTTETCLLCYPLLFTFLPGMSSSLTLILHFLRLSFTQKIYFNYRCPTWLKELQIRVKTSLKKWMNKINVIKRMMSIQLIITEKL